jgi:hypothetical protein
LTNNNKLGGLEAGEAESLAHKAGARMDQYVVYCFLGMAEGEDRKIFLWPQWERCFFLFDEILKPFARTSFIKSSLAYEIPLKARKGDLPGISRVTFKQVPLGRLRWNYEDNKKWSQRPLEKGKYPIRLLDTQILSSNVKTHLAEIQVYVCNRDSVPGAAYNQILTVSAVEPIFRARPADYWQGLMKELATVVRAVRVGRTARPWWLERPRGDLTEASSLAGAHFTKRYDSLDLEDSWQTWEYLK